MVWVLTCSKSPRHQASPSLSSPLILTKARAGGVMQVQAQLVPTAPPLNCTHTLHLHATSFSDGTLSGWPMCKRSSEALGLKSPGSKLQLMIRGVKRKSLQPLSFIQTGTYGGISTSQEIPVEVNSYGKQLGKKRLPCSQKVHFSCTCDACSIQKKHNTQGNGSLWMLDESHILWFFSCIKSFLRTYCAQVTHPGTRDTTINKTNKNPASS